MGYGRNYRPFLVFLAKFFLTYIFLGGAYQLWLTSFDSPGDVDPITVSVARQSRGLLEIFGVDSQTMPEGSHPYMQLLYEGDYVARIVEGCNAISVMILFIAFIVAFAGKWKSTVIFAICGCALIHVLNIIRIALLAAAIHMMPQHEHFLHGVVFPMFIYGIVFLLWVVWVNKFSDYANAKV